MTDFCLVRHGSYALLDTALGGRADHLLNQQGRAEAVHVGRVLANRKPIAVVSSPVARARETAVQIAAVVGQPVVLEPGFAEVDFGAWTGTSFSALASDTAWREWNTFRSTARVPGGEAMLTVQARAIAAMLRLAEVWPVGEVIIVSHADVIKAVLAHFLGSPLDLLRRMEIAPGSTSRIRLLGDDARVLDMNVR